MDSEPKVKLKKTKLIDDEAKAKKRILPTIHLQGKNCLNTEIKSVPLSTTANFGKPFKSALKYFSHPKSATH